LLEIEDRGTKLSNKRAANHDGYHLFHLRPSIIEADKFRFVHQRLLLSNVFTYSSYIEFVVQILSTFDAAYRKITLLCNSVLSSLMYDIVWLSNGKFCSFSECGGNYSTKL